MGFLHRPFFRYKSLHWLPNLKSVPLIIEATIIINTIAVNLGQTLLISRAPIGLLKGPIIRDFIPRRGEPAYFATCTCYLHSKLQCSSSVRQVQKIPFISPHDRRDSTPIQIGTPLDLQGCMRKLRPEASNFIGQKIHDYHDDLHHKKCCISCVSNYPQVRRNEI